MNKHFLKKAVTVMLSAIMIISLAACSKTTSTNPVKEKDNTAAQSNTSEKTETNKATPEPTKEEQKPVTIQFLSNPNQASIDVYKALADKFHEANPNITVEVTTAEQDKYATALLNRLSANEVDIFCYGFFSKGQVDWAPDSAKPEWQQEIEAGYFEDITDQPFTKNYIDTANAAFSYNGKQYGLGTGITAYNGIFYNKTMFEQYNLKTPQTWDEFINICETLKSNGVAPMTIGFADVWPYLMMTNAFVNANIADPANFMKDLYTGAKKFTDPEMMNIYNKIDQFNSYMEDGFEGVDYNSVIGRFVAGKAAMLPDGSWQAATIKQADANFKFGYFAIPGDQARTDGLDPQLAGKFDQGLIINAKTSDEKKAAALKFLEFFSEKENYAQFINAVGFLPTQPDTNVSDEFTNSLTPLLKDYTMNFEQLRYFPANIGDYGKNWLKGSYLKSAGGEFTVDEFAAQVQADWDAARGTK